MAYNLLQGKKGIIFGALDERSIAWKTALRCHEEGAQIVLSNAPVAMRMGEINKLAEAVNAPVIGADATSMEDLKKLFEGAMTHFGGGIDFVLHSIGMSLNVRKGKHYTEIDYAWNQKTLDISSMSLHRVLRTAWDLDAMNEWGSVVALTYIAAQRVFPTTMKWLTPNLCWKVWHAVLGIIMRSAKGEGEYHLPITDCYNGWQWR